MRPETFKVDAHDLKIGRESAQSKTSNLCDASSYVAS